MHISTHNYGTIHTLVNSFAGFLKDIRGNSLELPAGSSILSFTSYSLLNMDNFCKILILNNFWTMSAGANLQHVTWCWSCPLSFCSVLSRSQASLIALWLNTSYCVLAWTCYYAKFSCFPLFSDWYQHSHMHFCYKQDVSIGNLNVNSFYTSHALCLLQRKLQCIVMHKHDCIAASPEAQSYQPYSLTHLLRKQLFTLRCISSALHYRR
jgi:hypothetical protein